MLGRKKKKVEAKLPVAGEEEVDEGVEAEDEFDEEPEFDDEVQPKQKPKPIIKPRQEEIGEYALSDAEMSIVVSLIERTPEFKAYVDAMNGKKLFEMRQEYLKNHPEMR